MASPTPARRPVNLAGLEEFATRRKLLAAIVLPDDRRQNVTVPRRSFVPLIQAEVGSPVSLLVYRYRILIPVLQKVRESERVIRETKIASESDVDIIQETLIRHFGGITVIHQPPAPAFGIGARDPANVSATLEQNEHVAFEVYAAPIQESDDYFRALRRELEDALQEGVILIERQQVTLI